MGRLKQLGRPTASPPPQKDARDRMSHNLCPIDDRPIKDSAHLCHVCTAQVDEALRAIPELMNDLAVMLTKRAKVPAYGHIPATGADEGKPMTYSLIASRAKSELKSVLVSWARYVHEDHTVRAVIGHEYVWAAPRPIYGQVPAPLDCADTITSISGWLLQHTSWLRRQDIAPDLYREVVGSVNVARHLIDAPPVRQYVGRCGFRWQGTPCPAELWCPVGAPEVTCRTCGVVWNVEGRRTGALAKVMDRIESPETIARALGSHGVNINAERIYNWKKRGKLLPAGEDPRTKRAKYRLGDVMDLWHATQLSPQNTRRPKEPAS